MQTLIFIVRLNVKIIVTIVWCFVCVQAMEIAPRVENYMSSLPIPLDFQGEIIKKFFCLTVDMRDMDRQKLEKYFFEMPLALGVKFSQEFRDIQNFCKLPIKDRLFKPQEWFGLSQEERDIFNRMKDRSIFLLGDISDSDYKILSRTNSKCLRGMILKVNYADSRLEIFNNVIRLIFFIAMLRSALSNETNTLRFKDIFVAGSYAFLELFILGVHVFFNPHYKYDEEKYWPIEKVTL